MAWPVSLNVALKEWATVCAALESGRQMLLLRKGGIYESGGEFELEQRQFLLFPTYLHQSPAMLKSEALAGLEVRSAEPDQVRLSAAGVVTDIIPLQSRAQFDALDDEHLWTSPLIDMRFSYKPQNPLFLLLVRAYLLPAGLILANTPAYAGCKSWVPLEQEVAAGGSLPVLDDLKYDVRRQSILDRLGM